MGGGWQGGRGLVTMGRRGEGWRGNIRETINPSLGQGSILDKSSFSEKNNMSQFPVLQLFLVILERAIRRSRFMGRMNEIRGGGRGR